MILDIWKDKTLDYMTAANAIFHFLKDLYSLIQYFSIFFLFCFFMENEASSTVSDLWLLLAESTAKIDILILA